MTEGPCFRIGFHSTTPLGMPEEHAATNRLPTLHAWAADSRVFTYWHPAKRDGFTGMRNEIQCALRPISGLAIEEIGIDLRPQSPAEILKRFFSDPRVIQFQDLVGNQPFGIFPGYLPLGA